MATIYGDAAGAAWLAEERARELAEEIEAENEAAEMEAEREEWEASPAGQSCLFACNAAAVETNFDNGDSIRYALDALASLRKDFPLGEANLCELDMGWFSKFEAKVISKLVDALGAQEPDVPALTPVAVFPEFKTEFSVPSFSDFCTGRDKFPEIKSLARSVGEMTEKERAELWDEAKALASKAEFLVTRTYLTDADEEHYAERFMKRYDGSKSKLNTMIQIVIENYVDDDDETAA